MIKNLDIDLTHVILDVLILDFFILTTLVYNIPLIVLIADLAIQQLYDLILSLLEFLLPD